LLERIVMKVADRAIHRYIVYTAADRSIFSKMWGIDAKKVRECPVFAHYSFFGSALEPVAVDNYVFAGGESFRNFEPLIVAAARLPQYRFVFATSLLKGRTDLPDNVTLISPRFDEFMQVLRSARVVVIPLLQNMHRSAGAATYMNAMWLKKPVIVTEAVGVREYVEDKKTGLVVDGTPEGYIEALRWMLDPKNAAAVEHLCEEAHRVVASQFTVEHHVTRLLALIDEAIDEAQ
jgi:glycosyltransferase involved in cell wall biosynthesis